MQALNQKRIVVEKYKIMHPADLCVEIVKIKTHWSGAEYVIFWGENRALEEKVGCVMRFHNVA